MKEFPNFNEVHTIYVTDYTRNDQVAGVQSNWCTPSLSDYVLQMEMWDGAAEIARTMREGEYYLIKNARMRINGGGFLEGKVAESKIFLLEEDEAATNVHLQALLECVDHFTGPSPFFRDRRFDIQEEEALDSQTAGQTRYGNRTSINPRYRGRKVFPLYRRGLRTSFLVYFGCLCAAACPCFL